MDKKLKWKGNKVPKDKGQKKKKQKQNKNEKYAWKKVPPGTGKPKTKK